ncbi:cytochrome aa3 quinol oxidase subunit IV [Alicyclobacillus cycloheptanicus]|uniref:Quinol oxidase subunit 4 n=1 Tax=Alicyclobacillus cycloheptanicus TaxID=1457 RepID=A0ABT9XE93_9BACL|nr:cytochrome aa3 quinol oxidase subunit IV [Alicyclobacillus cycloheptanicus]MDQ0188621.1 cytochrome aa3 quinol oxidase subunit IV [Alicyclobacillus cycloheptanicus]WDM00700.1 cytochrome aa3 quinol oxidase subunit IV [Alicyclobacillus cycloheptanicus]
MSTQSNADGHSGAGHAFPWHHVIGFVISIVLTLIALWLVLNGVMPASGLMTVILLLAVLQIGVQLFFFMHITESPGPKYHVLALVFGAVFLITIVAGSIWIMSFGSTQAY